MKWHLRHVTLGDKPRAVQVEAMRRAEGRPRYGHWLEQRLGKTPLTLNEFMCSDCDVNVVVAPNSFKLDWALAPALWGLPEVAVGVWPRDDLPYDEDKAVFAVNYEAARTGGFRALDDLMKKRRCMLTIDESSNIKNPNSDSTRALIELSKRAHMVRELNGTPITQNVMDYWPQLRCLGELNGVNPYAFRNKYAKMGGFMGRQVVGMQEDREQQLFELLDRCTFRALRKDWLAGHRDAESVITHLDMTKKQTVHYAEMMEEFYTLVDGMEVSAELVLTQMDKLRQISSCMIMNQGDVRWIEKPKEIPKVKAALDIHEAGAGKTIVVHFYRPTGLMLQEFFTSKKLQPAIIRGQMKPEALVEEKRRFNNDPNCRVLIAQQSAAAMGHELFGVEGDRCDRMVFFENSFNLRDRLQMQDRNYYDYANRGTWDLVTSPMDQVAVDALTTKKGLADRIDAVVAAVRAGHSSLKTRTTGISRGN